MKRFFVISLFLFFLNSLLYSAFEDIGHDSRAKGMANAFYAEPGGISSLYYNPAGTSFTKSFEAIASLGLPHTGLGTVDINTFNIAALFPFTYHFKYDFIFKNAVVGLGMNNISFYYEGSEYFDDDTIDYYERIITINMSKHFVDFMIDGIKFGVGVNFDILLNGFTDNIYSEKNSSYFADGTDAAGFGMDIGFLYILNDNLHVGIVLDNLFEPDVAFNEDVSEEPVKRNRKVGLSWKEKKLWKFNDVTIASGFAFEDLKTDTWEYRLGVESWEFNRLLGIRLGYELSDEGMNNLCFGLSGNKTFQEKHDLQVNYSFIIPISTIQSTYGSHTFSLVYRFRFPANSFEFDLSKRGNEIVK